MPNTQPIGVAYSDPEFTTCYASQEIGYSAAAQGTVTQATSKSTAVTLNKSAGQITMNNAALAGSTAGAYTTYVSNMTTGSASITLRNLTTATSYSEAVVINFSIIHCQS